MNAGHTLFRPPSEGESLIIRVADGCPHNTCTFCGMYKGVPYQIYPPAALARMLDEAVRVWPDAHRIFLADGDVMALSFERLRDILADLNHRFPNLARVNLYANGSSIAAKTDAQLAELRALRLQTLYLGLESGDQTVLDRTQKGERVATMISAAQRASAAGLRMSVMVLVGLAGRAGSGAHAAATAQALNEMQPPFLAALRTIPTPGTPLHDELAAGSFAPLTELEAVQEIRALIAELQLGRTLFRANHVSNIIPLAGRFPRDKGALLEQCDQLIASRQLDAESQGPMPHYL